MFRSPTRSSSGSSLFTSLSMLLILKTIKYLKSINIHRGYVAAAHASTQCALQAY